MESLATTIRVVDKIEPAPLPMSVLRSHTMLTTALAFSIATWLTGGQVTTWIVDGAGGGDFLTIQSAVDVSTNGDLILVRPGTDYGAFEINGKGVIVMSESATENFVVAGETWPIVSIRGVDPTMGPAGVVGVECIGVNGGFYVLNCSTTVILEDVTAVGGFGDSALTETRLTIDSSSNVSVTSATLTGTSTISSAGNGIAEPTVSLFDSTVRMHELFVRGSAGVDGENCILACEVNATAPGETGMSVSNSALLLSDCQILGGQGGFGTSVPVDFYSFLGGSGSNGGLGLDASNSTIFLLGADDVDHKIEGGEGGNAAYSDVSCPSGGDGGNALRLTNTTFFASRIDLIGGDRGTGCIDGVIGDIGAVVTIDDNYPLFHFDPLHLSDNISFVSDGVHDGNSVLFFSASLDPINDNLPNYGGPPLSLVAPGALGLSGGNFVLPITVPNANSLLGSIFHFQVALNGGPGANHVSNPVSRVVRP